MTGWGNNLSAQYLVVNKHVPALSQCLQANTGIVSYASCCDVAESYCMWKAAFWLIPEMGTAVMQNTVPLGQDSGTAAIKMGHAPPWPTCLVALVMANFMVHTGNLLFTYAHLIFFEATSCCIWAAREGCNVLVATLTIQQCTLWLVLESFFFLLQWCMINVLLPY